MADEAHGQAQDRERAGDRGNDHLVGLDWIVDRAGIVTKGERR